MDFPRWHHLCYVSCPASWISSSFILTTWQRTNSFLHPISLGLPGPAIDANHRQPNRNHCRTQKNHPAPQMGHSYPDYTHKYRRLHRLDPSTHGTSCQPNVGFTPSNIPQLKLTGYSFVRINDYWDRISKALILVVDAALNWYFLRTVKIRLLQQNRLTKYEPLVSFNAKLMVVSIAMDVKEPQARIYSIIH